MNVPRSIQWCAFANSGAAHSRLLVVSAGKVRYDEVWASMASLDCFLQLQNSFGQRGAGWHGW
jgi:hypothetical protein